MSIKRVCVLLRKEFLQGPRSFIFIWVIVAPVLISLVVSLIFGTLFTNKPRLGIIDEGSSKLAAGAQQLDSVITKTYSTVSKMKQAAKSGSVDLGIVLPKDLDDSIEQETEATITAYIWGQSLAKNRSILEATVMSLVRELAGQSTMVEIESATLGQGSGIPWSDRILPFIVLMAVFMGGLFVPALSIINEKEKGTFRALIITPTRVTDVFVAKGVVGTILSLIMGIAILALNQAFGISPLLLILVLALGAIMASEIGLICGAFLKDATTLFAVWKLGGIVLFAPALVYMFPQIPEWIGKIMPTYYVIKPVVQITQQGGGWLDISTNVFVLIGLDLFLVGLVMLSMRKSKYFAR